MANSTMEPRVVAATSFDKERVPSGFTKAPAVAIILPSAFYIKLLESQQDRSFDYHLLIHPTYVMFDPIDFDADAYVNEAIKYCREHKVNAVFAFDCFPAMLCSIVKEELKLHGPASWSTFLCINKYYLRKHITPEFGPICVAPTPPEEYPAVIKVADTQFYIGTHIVDNRSQWDAAWADCQEGIMKNGVRARQEFYFKWGRHFGWPTGWKSADDVVLAHTEPCMQPVGEYQAEVVVKASGQLLLSDTGDIDKGKDTHWITIFKTPATCTITPKLRDFLRHVAGKLSGSGYKSGAMDIEFMRLPGDCEKYQVVEINSRYSYMGNYLHMGHPDGALRNAKDMERQNPLEVRNLLNRTRLALGANPEIIPCRDRPNMSKIAVMFYTNQGGDLKKCFDTDLLAKYVEDGTLDGFAPKVVYKQGKVTDFDLRQFNGWAKIGCALATWENRQESINAKLSEITSKLFYDKEDNYLKIKVTDEDGDAPLDLNPYVLELGPDEEDGAAKCACQCTIS